MCRLLCSILYQRYTFAGRPFICGDLYANPRLLGWSLVGARYDVVVDALCRVLSSLRQEKTASSVRVHLRTLRSCITVSDGPCCFEREVGSTILPLVQYRKGASNQCDGDMEALKGVQCVARQCQLGMNRVLT